MATTIQGGAAAVQDIGARNTTGAAVRVGDILALDFDASTNGYNAVVPRLVNQKDYIGMHGVVLGQTGTTYADQAHILLRVRGVVSARVESTQDIADEDLLLLTDNQRYLLTTAAQVALGAAVNTPTAATSTVIVAADVAIAATAVAAVDSAPTSANPAAVTSTAVAAADAVAPTAATSTAVAAADAAAPTAATSTAVAAADLVALAADGSSDVAAAAIPSGSSIVASPATLTNLGAPTSFASQHSVTGGTLAVGDILEIYASGVQVSTNGADTTTVELRFGGDAFVSTPAIVPVAGDVWILRGTVVVRTIGAGGTWVGSGTGYFGTPSSAAGAVDVPFADFIGSTVDDTTGALIIDVLVTHSAASPNNQTRMDVLNVKVVRPESATSLLNELRADYNLLRAEVTALRTAFGNTLTLANENKADFNAMRVDLESAAVPIRTTVGALVTLANENKLDYNAMRVDLESAATPIRTTVGALVTLANETKADYNAARVDLEGAGALREVATELVADVAQLATLANETKADYNVLRGEVAGEVQTLANETKADYNAMRVDLESAAQPIRTSLTQAQAILSDLEEMHRVRAIALAARTANSEGLIDVYLPG